MSGVSWGDLLATAVGGGVAVKLLDIAYRSLSARFGRKHSARTVVDQHLDPILKAADEIVGKIRSLAEEDFSSLIRSSGAVGTPEYRVLVLLYLLASFWARIELLRRDAIGISIQAHPTGKRLKQFMDCMESRRVRLVDRAIQRAIGETLIDRDRSPTSTILFVEFAARVKEPGVWRWYEPLHAVVTRMRHTRDRQRLLQYGAVVHALIDTLDPKHQVTGSRPGWPNKLTQRTRRALRFGVFGNYLTFVAARGKYTGWKEIAPRDLGLP
jgi:hypothetical protein